jgi:hypothetical protein
MDSNMNIHVKVVAVLHILSGVLGLIAAVVIFAVFGVAGGIVISQGEPGAATVIGIVALLIGGFLAVLALPGIIGGWGLLAQKQWARVLIIVLGVLHLLNFPFGTALGVYTLWVLLSKEQHLVGPSAADSSSPQRSALT